MAEHSSFRTRQKSRLHVIIETQQGQHWNAEKMTSATN